MAKLSLAQTSFNAGEISPRMHGRFDLEKYGMGAKTLLNFVVQPEGGVLRRSGTRWVAEVEDSTVRSRLVAFIFSTTQAYTLEFCDLKMRVFKNEGIVIAPTTTFEDADVTVAGDHIGITAHFYEGEQGPFQLTSTGTLPAGLALLTDYYIIKNSVDQIELSLTAGGAAVNITAAAGGGTHTLTPSGIVPYEVVLPYAEADLPDLQFAQSADTLYVVHPDHPPAVITRTGHSSWAHADIVFEDGPYLDINTTDITVDPDAATGTVTLTPSEELFTADDEGRLFRLSDGAEWWWGVLSNHQAGAPDTIDWTIQAVTGVVVDDDTMANSNATKVWRFGAWGSAAALGYPRVVSFYEQRLCF